MNAVEVPEQGASIGRGVWRIRRLAVYVRSSTARVVVGLAAMLVATAAGLTAPYLAKVAIDDAIVPRDLTALAWIVAGVPGGVADGLRGPGHPDVPDRLCRRADPDRPPRRPVRAPAVPRARVLREEPGRRPHLAPDERRRGAAAARHRRHHLHRPEHADADRLDADPVLARLAAGARDHRRVPADGGGDGALPHLLGARLPAHARAARAGDGDAAGGPVRRARAAGVRPGGGQPGQLPVGQRLVPRRQPADRLRERLLLPGGRLPVEHRHRDRVRLRRLAVHPGRPRPGHAGRLHRLPVELLRSGAAAVAAVQHVPRRHRRARQDLRRDGRAPEAGRRARRRRRGHRGRGRLRRRPLRLPRRP